MPLLFVQSAEFNSYRICFISSVGDEDESYDDDESFDDDKKQ